MFNKKFSDHLQRSWVAVGVGVGSAVIKGVAGAKQKKEGRALLSSSPRPDYVIPNEVTQTAKEGLPSQQYDAAMKNIQAKQAQLVGAGQDRRSGLSTLARLQGMSNNATLNLNVEDAKMRRQNQQRLTGYQDKAWAWNKQGKYNEDIGYGMSLLGAGNANTIGALDSAGAAVGTAAYMGAFKGKGSTTQKYFQPLATNYPRVGQDYTTADYQIPQ